MNQLRPETFPKVEDNSDMILHYKNAVGIYEGSWDLPASYHSQTHTGRLTKIMLDGPNAMFGLWLTFFREHCAGFLALKQLRHSAGRPDLVRVFEKRRQAGDRVFLFQVSERHGSGQEGGHDHHDP